MLRLCGCAVVSAGVYLFIYNSGWGYDALEVFFVSRSLGDGCRFYDYAPAKPAGIYVLVAPLCLGTGPPRWVVAAAVFGLWAMATGSAWGYARHWFGSTVGLVSAMLVGTAALFMELNYLVVEGVVSAAGFCSLELLARYDRLPGPSRLVATGAVLGVAFWFKQTAGLYALGAAVWLALHSPWRQVWGRWLYLTGGWLATVAPGVAYFAATGRAGDFFEWTFLMPAATPSSTEYLAKTSVKLGWVAVVVGAAAVIILTGRFNTAALRSNRNLRGVVVMGALAALPALKSQAPHYLFPAAAMALVFSAVVFAHALASRSGTRFGATRGRWTAIGLAGLGVAVAVSAVAYRPSAVLRFVTVRSFDAEDRLRDAYRRTLPPTGSVLFLGPDPLTRYVMTGRYPPPRTAFHFDTQSEYLLAKDAAHWLRVLDDPSLAAVEYDPSRPPELRFDRASALEVERRWEQFHARLATLFRPAEGPGECPVWLRR